MPHFLPNQILNGNLKSSQHQTVRKNCKPSMNKGIVSGDYDLSQRHKNVQLKSIGNRIENMKERMKTKQNIVF